MANAAERLKQARELAGFGTAREAADRFGWNYNTYAANENGNAPFSFNKAKTYARSFGVRPEWLYDGSGTIKPTRRRGLPILGKVGAGGEGDFLDDYEIGAADSYVEFDPDEESTDIVLTVEGDSMVPRFFPREKVQFGRRYDDPSPLIGREVMARLADGRKLLKILQSGDEPGRFTLYSVNTAYEPIRNVELLWALPFKRLHAA